MPSSKKSYDIILSYNVGKILLLGFDPVKIISYHIFIILFCIISFSILFFSKFQFPNPVKSVSLSDGLRHLRDNIPCGFWHTMVLPQQDAFSSPLYTVWETVQNHIGLCYSWCQLFLSKYPQDYGNCKHNLDYNRLLKSPCKCWIIPSYVISLILKCKNIRLRKGCDLL